jgi:hypothetical protein
MRRGGELAKAVAAGADVLMIGSPLAKADEAPGRGTNWGMAAPSPTLPRGTRIKVGTTGTLERILLGPAHVTDGSENLVYNTKLGFGPAIYTMDGSTLHDPRLVRFLQATAEAEKIPCQLRQPGGGGTDSGAIQRALAGIPTVSVSVPHRYTHSPVSISRIDDWKNTLKLMHAALERITPQLLVRS